MIGIILALLLGYWLGKNEKKEPKQINSEYTGSVEYNGVDYGYVREGESAEDLI
ncbi:MAG: hypothetical protein KGI02_03440 [Thaumarchaeota archaeon]|nr:hypothetical protein [Nitrososphaerota archaeon]MDE1877850.1 hypothetical protein [Nitrososphaerota archaeon]